MKVLTFEKRFAPLVESGEKTRTIRKRRKRFISSGESLSLREWTGRPYASKQRVLREVARCAVTAVEIRASGARWVTPGLTFAQNWDEWKRTPELNEFARSDGFADWEEMKAWFEKTHGLPFEGVMISWDV